MTEASDTNRTTSVRAQELAAGYRDGYETDTERPQAARCCPLDTATGNRRATVVVAG